MPEIDDLIAMAPEQSGVVIAGPGTGKTHRIGERIASVLAKDVNLEDIVVVTLTNETVKSLRKRLPTVPVQTMHSWALSRLNEVGDAVRRRPADAWEERNLVCPDIQALARLAGVKVDVDAVPKFLTRLGAGFRTTAGIAPSLTTEEEALRAAWMKVRDFLLLRLFDELAFDLLALMRDGHDLARPPKSMLVDEYQDLTPVELELIHLIAERYGTGVFAAGDDRQSIYGFREADPFGLNNFADVYGTDGPAYMSKSFRCRKRVLALAEAVATHMPIVPGLSGRPAMESSDDLGDGEVRVATFKSIQAETAFIVRDIARRVAERPPAEEPGGDEDTDTQPKEDIAVIVPRGVEIYEAALNEASVRLGFGLAFRDSRDATPLASDTGFRFVLAVLRIADDADDELAWRALVHLGHGIGASRLQRMYAEHDRLTVALRAESAVDSAARTLVEAVEKARAAVNLAEDEAGVREAVEGVADAIGFGQTLPWDGIKEAVDADPEEAVTPTPHRVLLSACRTIAHKKVSEDPPEANEIRIYTVFAAKGQQWDHVYVAGAFYQAFLDQAPADGLRRLYVALTRAMHSLTVTLPRYVKHTQLSRVIGADATGLLPAFAEACTQAGVDRETDPDT
jgi:superfamily I DNA/RNA helicase